METSSHRWFIDKESKVPLYLQLKELIRYYISTGTILTNERLPTVKDLSNELEINFETVRKAYKELEREGLLTTQRGKGTVANNHLSLKSQDRLSHGPEAHPLDSIKDLLKRLLQKGVAMEEIRIMVAQALSEVSSEKSEQMVIFTECSLSQVNEISTLLKSYLNLNVEPVLLKDLRNEVEKISMRHHEILAVLTTGFHMSEVRQALASLPVKIDFLVTNMSLETRRHLDGLDKTARYGFICRDPESIPFYRDMLKEELSLVADIDCCVLTEEARVRELFSSVDVLLVSPPVYDDVKALAPARLRIFNVFNRVDPMSLMIVKERILGAIATNG